MNVLIACECSGIVKTAFRNLGHEANSCDLKPSEIPNDRYHFQCDLRALIKVYPHIDLLIAHPDCTLLAVSGARWWPDHRIEQLQAIEFVKWIAALPIDRIAIENPIGILSTLWRPADQIIQPHSFGEDASKATCLWLKGLPLLIPTLHVPPTHFRYDKYGNGRWVYANQTGSGQNILSPNPNRKADRARTYQGIADAMAKQWS
jgi:hypothetical protein